MKEKEWTIKKERKKKKGNDMCGNQMKVLQEEEITVTELSCTHMK